MGYVNLMISWLTFECKLCTIPNVFVLFELQLTAASQ